MKDLVDDYAKVPIIKSDPIVTYKETVTEESSEACMCKSPNKHNRITAKASPLEEGLAEDIESGKVNDKDDSKARAKYLFEEYGWEKDMADKRLWSFGPENAGPNTLIDATKGI